MNHELALITDTTGYIDRPLSYGKGNAR